MYISYIHISLLHEYLDNSLTFINFLKDDMKTQVPDSVWNEICETFDF